MYEAIDWENLGFSYMKLPYRYNAYFKDGQWNKELTEDATCIFQNHLQVPHLEGSKHLKD